MLIVYATALLSGGIFLLATMALGHHDVGGAGHDIGVAHDGAHDGSSASSDHADDSGLGFWLPFLSLRFWTFGVAFFGLTGVLLAGLELATETETLAASLGTGFVCGATATLTIRALSRREVNSLPTELSFVGETADVLLDVAPGQPGRIRVSARGSLVDMPAVVEVGSFAHGDRVLVLDVDDGTAKVGPIGSGVNVTKT